MTSMSEQERAAKSRRMGERIRTYIDACNAGDAERTMSCFTPDAVHYFPPGMDDAPFQGAALIAEKWRTAVAELGSFWTVDQLIIDPDTDRAVTEWTHFKTKLGKVLRGAEWFVFDRETGLIKEARAYYASPQDPSLDTLELGGFDYRSRGYPLAPPPDARG